MNKKLFLLKRINENINETKKVDKIVKNETNNKLDIKNINETNKKVIINAINETNNKVINKIKIFIFANCQGVSICNILINKLDSNLYEIYHLHNYHYIHLDYLDNILKNQLIVIYLFINLYQIDILYVIPKISKHY